MNKPARETAWDVAMAALHDYKVATAAANLAYEKAFEAANSAYDAAIKSAYEIAMNGKI